jgi:hypothetical protein
MAVEPKKFLEYLKEKEDKLIKILPELEKIDKIPQKIDTEIFEGKEGVKTFYMYLSQTKREVVGFGITGLAYDILEFYAPKLLENMSKKVRARYIAFDKTRNKEITKLKNTEYRYFPKEVDNYATTLIFDDYIAILTYKDIPRVVLIKDTSISEGYKKYFEFMWKIAKP